MMNLKPLMIPVILLGGAAGSSAYEVTIFPADANGDGIVTAAEHTRHHGTQLTMDRHHRAGERHAQLGPTPAGEVTYWRADANRDGYVSQDERQEHRDRLARMRSADGMPPHPVPAGIILGVPPNEAGEATYRPADLNRDGYASNEEWKRYRQRLEMHSGS